MTFTDDDLKRLKERNIGVEGVFMGSNELNRLLARLQTAESYAVRFDPIDPTDFELFDAWEKTKK